MNKEELAGALSKRTNLTRRQAKDAIDAVCQIITEALADGDRVKLVGFGVFEVRNRAKRTGRDPRKNTGLIVPAKKLPVFKPGKFLKQSVSQSESDSDSF